MSELMIYKANELAISRYDLTEHETKLILCCVALLNPMIENPTREQRTVVFSCSDYAKMLGISPQNAWGRLNSATSELFKRYIEIIYPTGPISKRMFNWVNYAEFNRYDQTLKLVFSEDIIPYLFQLKKFIKYDLEHVKAFENKYSMRVYEWLLKELTQRKTHKANIQISIDEFKFMMMLENNYSDLRNLTSKVLSKVTNDLNTYSNMKLSIQKKGRPADTLIFQVELDKQIGLVKKLSKQDDITLSTVPQSPKTNIDDDMYSKLVKALEIASMSKITLSEFESKFLNDMKAKYDLNGSFSWLSERQRNTLFKVINKYRI